MRICKQQKMWKIAWNWLIRTNIRLTCFEIHILNLMHWKIKWSGTRKIVLIWKLMWTIYISSLLLSLGKSIECLRLGGFCTDMSWYTLHILSKKPFRTRQKSAIHLNDIETRNMNECDEWWINTRNTLWRESAYTKPVGSYNLTTLANKY